MSSQLAFGWPVACAVVVALAAGVVGFAAVAVGLVVVVALVVVPVGVVESLDAFVIVSWRIVERSMVCVAGALTRDAPAAPCPPPCILSADNAAAETSDNAHAAAVVVINFSFRVLIQPPRT
jgi:hypothetical protein